MLYHSQNTSISCSIASPFQNTHPSLVPMHQIYPTAQHIHMTHKSVHPPFVQELLKVFTFKGVCLCKKDIRVVTTINMLHDPILFPVTNPLNHFRRSRRVVGWQCIRDFLAGGFHSSVNQYITLVVLSQ